MTLETLTGIGMRADRYVGCANLAAVNKAFREQYGIGIAERAIRKVRSRGEICYGLDYALKLDAEIN